MPLSTTLLLLASSVAATWALTGTVRIHALRSGRLDHPNARSSHSLPTPRGGGVAIVICFLALVASLSGTGIVERDLAVALLGGGPLIAALGYADDRRPLAARWRFLGHLIAASWVLAWLGPLPAVPLFGVTVDLGLGAILLSALYLVWSINLFNFMDGIDGIASLEAIAVALGGALVWWWTQPSGDWRLAVLFAACIAGFLIWNFPSARIFMGDAGSGFLGFVLATLALWSSHTAAHLFWSWFILGGCFMVDSTMTLVRRVARGERFNEAHRSHAYQYASRVHQSHKVISIAVVIITAMWLFPIALLVATKSLDGLVGVTIAYLPLGALAWRYKAGDRSAQEM